MSSFRAVVRSSCCVLGRISRANGVYRTVHCTDSQSLRAARHFSTTHHGGLLSDDKDVKTLTDNVEQTPVPPDDPFKERFIPMTRHSLVRHILQEEDLLTSEERRRFEGFASALDSAVVNRYHSVLEELKVLFDPINPDKDTIKTRKWNRRERLDNEFWLLQKLATVMERANFHELPGSEVKRALSEHSSREGVMVSVDGDQYDVLRFWALGKETPTPTPPVYRRLYHQLTRSPLPPPIEFYKRAVVVCRLKSDDKLMLKAFKEVPVNALEQLLPSGKLVMSKWDYRLISGSLALAVTGLVAKLVSYLAHIHVDWMLLVTVITGTVGIRAWTVYKNRRNAYLLELSRMLYFKNIANNRGLLTLVVDRAEDELFKELLLTYVFLLTSRPPSVASKLSAEQSPEELGGMSQLLLQHKICDWLVKKTGSRVYFDAEEAVELLASYGIVSEDAECLLHVLPLEAAMRNLPQSRQRLSLREAEHEAVEAYEYMEEEYREEAKARRRFGWF